VPVEHEVDLGGPAHYVDWGGSGSPLLLIHGLSGSTTNWAAVAPGLAERHRVYALDFIGHGKTPLAGRTANLANHRRLIDRFLAEIVGEPATVVGNSTGGHLAIIEAAAAPERVRGLVLVDPSVPMPSGAINPTFAVIVAPLLVRGVGEVALRARFSRIDAEAAVRDTLKLCSPHPERIPSWLVQRHIDEYADRHATRDSVRAFLQTGRSLFWHNARRRLFSERCRAVRCPVLVIQGDKDRLVPMSSVEAMLAIRPDWQLEVLSDVGHISMMEVPDEFNRVVNRWLDKHETRAA
jgi:pimeloyl-ACP methyl ester carboxylesterase